MTEAEWLACKDPTPMLWYLRGKASQRKLRLFAVACCRSIEFADERSGQALSVAERFADGLATPAERRDVHQSRRAYSLSPRNYEYGPESESVTFAVHGHALVAARRAAEWSRTDAGVTADYLAATPDDRLPDAERAHTLARERQSHLLRDIFGNPFRPVTFSPSWRTSTVVALASQMYESRKFGAMPILADALQDAGCDSADVLDHCRGLGPHVRGCWVVDRVLGKE